MQTIQLYTVSDEDRVRERPQARMEQTLFELAHQEPYKLRRRGEFVDPSVIKFVVNGQEGIRLSDASECNWEGFEDGDDRSLFGWDRSQILVRLHVSHLVDMHYEPID